MPDSAEKSTHGPHDVSRTHRPPAPPRKSSALQGASLAFNASRSTPLKSSVGFHGTNDALAAASAVRRSKAGNANRGSVAGADGFHDLCTNGGLASSLRRLSDGASRDTLLNPDLSRGPSPSHAAALLAVSRASSSKPTTQHPLYPATGMRPKVTRTRSDFTKNHSPDLVTEQNLPTKKLVAAFESLGTTEPGTQDTSKTKGSGGKPRIVSPIPVRPVAVRTSFLHAQGPEQQPSRSKQPSQFRVTYDGQQTARKSKSLQTAIYYRQQELEALRGKPSPPSTRGGIAGSDNQIPTSGAPSSPIPPESLSLPSDCAEPSPITSVISPSKSAPSASESRLSSFPVPSPTPSLLTSSSPLLRRSMSIYGSGPHAHTPEPTLSLTSLTPQLTADSLANAMVASSLASSRTASPAKFAPPTLPPPRRPRPTSSFFRRARSSEAVPTSDKSRMGSPVKYQGFSKQTLRALPDEGGGDASHWDVQRGNSRSPWKKNHANKHRADRLNQWQDGVTEKERKRYEGLWAANKGLLFTHPAPEIPLAAESQADQRRREDRCPATNDIVHPFIVRDIYRRSHLPDHILAEIWDLVYFSASSPPSGLTRESFIVGLWLIDQKLQGRKLPNKVSEPIWGSVRGMSGVKIPEERNRKIRGRR